MVGRFRPAGGWTLDDLADRMGGNVDVNRCTLDIMTLRDPRMNLGQETADALGRAFGTGPEVWLNLDAAWLAGATRCN